MEEFQSSKYIHKFKSTLDDMSLYCNIPLGVIRSSESITRKPFWPWIRTKALEQLTENPLEVVNFFGLELSTPPDVFAWYHVLYLLFLLFPSNPSMITGAISSAIEYGTDEKFITRTSAKLIYSALTNPNSPVIISQVDKTVPSTSNERDSATARATAQGCGCLSVLLVIYLLIAFFGD